MSKVLVSHLNRKPKDTDSSIKGGNVSRPVKPEIRIVKKRFVKMFLSLLVLAIVSFFTKGIASKTAFLYIMGENGKQSGRKSGSVLMRNGRGRGMAFFATVLNSFTSAAKAVFSFFNSNWRAITEGERLTWLNYEKFVSNRFAQPVKVTGKTAYVQLNVNIANAGGSVIDVAPSKLIANPPYTALTGLSADASTGLINISYVLNTSGQTSFIFATKPLSPGISKPSKTAFRLVSLGDFSAASPLLFGADYVTRFGAITGNAGSKIFVRVITCDSLTGLTSIASEVSTIIVP